MTLKSLNLLLFDTFILNPQQILFIVMSVVYGKDTTSLFVCVGAVGELERQLQQEQTASQDLRCSLEEAQSRSTGQHLQLEAGQKLMLDLKVELEECTQELHLSRKSKEELQAQIHKLR